MNKDLNERIPKDLTDTDESYSIKILGESGEIYLEANQYSGIVRGLSTLSQLIKHSSNEASMFEVAHLPIEINDSPRFPYRGLMLDTSRRFYSVDAIKQVLYAMNAAKFNVFHWHFADDDSFPVELNTYPNLTYHAAFSADRVYSVEQVKDIVNYASSLAIRVIPEFDNPGHARSIGLDPNFSEIIRCFNKDWANTVPGAYKINGGPPTGVLDPSYQKTYDLLQAILK